MGRRPDPARKEDVLSQAVEYLAKEGLSNLSLRKLAAAMGTSTNAISYQFGSKEALVEAALASARQTTLAQLEEIRADPRALSVGDAVLQLWDWWLEDPRHLLSTKLRMEAMMASDEDMPPDRRPELLSFWIEYFADWIQGERQQGMRDATIQSTILMALLSGLVVDLQSTGDKRRLRSALVSYLESWAISSPA